MYVMYCLKWYGAAALKVFSYFDLCFIILFKLRPAEFHHFEGGRSYLQAA